MFFPLNLKQKIFLGYFIMVSFTILVGMYAIINLKELNSITSSVINDYTETSRKLINLNDSLQAQDLYEKRYLMLQLQDAETQFWTRNKEFKTILAQIGGTQESVKNIIENITSYHDKYSSIFVQELELIKDRNLKGAEALSSGELKSNFNKILLAVKDIDLKIKAQQNMDISRSKSLSERALIVTITLSLISIFLGLLFATLITSHLNVAIERLKEAADSIRSGDFDNLPEIRGADELADLAISFKEMSTRLKELGEINLDANPLTKLPGNLAIEKELLTRLNETQRFSFCLIDLDNFKAYNDRYSYARGSDLIVWVSDLLVRVKKEYGEEEDFLGHIGGDDFVMICAPDRVQIICNKIIEEFDKGIPVHYDSEDAQRGFIISLDRNDKPAMFGIMTVSIAVVNTDRTLIRDPKEIAQKVAELKRYAKSFSKSIVIMDRRRSP